MDGKAHIQHTVFTLLSQEDRFYGEPLRLASPYGRQGDKPPCIRSLDYEETSGRIIVGTATCDIWEATDVVQARSGAVFQCPVFSNGCFWHLSLFCALDGE